MTILNKGAKDAALVAGARAATDVTGFGLLGHLHHLASASGLAAKIRMPDVPTLDFVRELAETGLVPGGSKRNLEYVAPHMRFRRRRRGGRPIDPRGRADIGWPTHRSTAGFWSPSLIDRIGAQSTHPPER